MPRVLAIDVPDQDVRDVLRLPLRPLIQLARCGSLPARAALRRIADGRADRTDGAREAAADALLHLPVLPVVIDGGGW